MINKNYKNANETALFLIKNSTQKTVMLWKTFVFRFGIAYHNSYEKWRMPSSGMWRRIDTRRHIPEDGILHRHRRENLKSYNLKSDFYIIIPFWTGVTKV
jgi:hypothetical protein